MFRIYIENKLIMHQTYLKKLCNIYAIIYQSVYEERPLEERARLEYELAETSNDPVDFI